MKKILLLHGAIGAASQLDKLKEELKDNFEIYTLSFSGHGGEKIPDDTAIDKNGIPTNDPAEAMEGALLPFDRSYKSAGIAMLIEMLAGPLVSSAWIDNKTFEEEWGSVLIAIDPELLVDREVFKKNATDLIAKVKSSRRDDKVDEIRLPGERAQAVYQESLASGFVEVDDAILKTLGY